MLHYVKSISLFYRGNLMTQNPKVKWILTETPIKDLKPHAKNPRQIGKDQFNRLGEMIDEFGLIDKPIINADFTIIGGHQRIKYLKKKKLKTVECWKADRQLSDAEIDKLCIGLNLHQGNFDFDVLADQWEVLDLLKYGFTEEQLYGKFNDAEEIKEEEKKTAAKKQTCCPNCGYEF